MLLTVKATCPSGEGPVGPVGPTHGLHCGGPQGDGKLQGSVHDTLGIYYNLALFLHLVNGQNVKSRTRSRQNSPGSGARPSLSRHSPRGPKKRASAWRVTSPEAPRSSRARARPAAPVGHGRERASRLRAGLDSDSGGGLAREHQEGRWDVDDLAEAAAALAWHAKSFNMSARHVEKPFSLQPGLREAFA